jgi:glycosyltransferase involved in cell wall biosynthesis
MKINITSYGYFGYYLAHQLYKKNHLNNLYTNLPRFKTNEIINSHIKRNIFYSFPYLLNKIHLNNLSKLLNFYAIDNFDKWILKNLTHCQIFHSFSSFALNSLKESKKRYNSMIMVERGSTHIEFQNDIIKNEYKKWKFKYQDIDSRIMERELEEYEISDLIIVQSSFAKNTFIKKGINKNKIIKIPLGIDLSLFRPLPKKDDMFRVLYSGNFSIRKGSLYLLDAIKTIKLKKFEFMFNGTIDKMLIDIFKQNSDLINYTGYQPFNKLYKIYSQASVFVLPTIEDGFAKVIIESMSCGVPVIATKNSAADDIITDGVDGFIISACDSNAIYEKIIYLYENPIKLREMAYAALKKVNNNYSIDDYGKRVIDEYSINFKKFQKEKK